MASQVPHANSSFHDLPIDLLAGVLQHVEQKYRLQFCAVVCKKWQQASNMATCRVVDAVGNKQGLESLSLWLCSNRHVSNLQSIQTQKMSIGQGDVPVLHLPVNRLARLEGMILGECRLKAISAWRPLLPIAEMDSAALTSNASDSQSGSLSALTGLSRLCLSSTVLDISQLDSCTALQHLKLNAVRHAPHASLAEVNRRNAYYSYFPPQLAAALPQLTQLTCLDLRFVGDQLLADTACLSDLQQLQTLKLSGVSLSAIDLEALPASLTALLLGPPVYPVKVPDLQHLTQLQRLHLWGVDADSALLSKASQLTWLCLDGCEVDGSTHQAAGSVMSVLQQMKQLEHLGLTLGELRDEEDDENDDQDDKDFPSPEIFTAIAASSHLTFLDLKECEFPLATNRHIFAAADALKVLKVLRSGSCLFQQTGDLERLVACCPALEQLELVLEDWRGRPQSGDDEPVDIDMQGLSALTHLTALTKMMFERIDLNDAAIKHIGACTRLRDLTIQTEAFPVTPLTVADMMSLTQLTGLTRLDLSIEFEDDQLNEELVSTADPPDVSLQLEDVLLCQLEKERDMYGTDDSTSVREPDSESNGA